MTGSSRLQETYPILEHDFNEPAIFAPNKLLDKAAVMLGRSRGALPESCVLDFDGELVPVANSQFGASPCSEWTCFHTTLWRVESRQREMGLIGGTVGAPFAVLVAEQLLAAGCRFIIGYSSAGAVSPTLRLPCFNIPDRAVRDEGTSYHYLDPSFWVTSRGRLPEAVAHHITRCELPVVRGATWSTDAPYRETRSQLERHRSSGVLSVEMEAAALMALSHAKQAEIASLIHITNKMGAGEEDFHKGPADIHKRIIESCLDAFDEAIRAENSNEGS